MVIKMKIRQPSKMVDDGLKMCPFANLLMFKQFAQILAIWVWIEHSKLNGKPNFTWPYQTLTNVSKWLQI